jgi:predicted dienelactone hydrolase
MSAAQAISTRDVQLTYENHSLSAALWFPSQGGSHIRPYQEVFSARAYSDGVVKPGQFPLVLMSHGSGGNQYSLAYLAEALARAGFFVVAIKHQDELPERDLWLRFQQFPARMKMAYEALKNNAFSSSIDFSSCATVGFSIGGYAAAINAGWQPDFCQAEHLQDVQQPLSEVDFTQFHIKPLKALVLLDPAISAVFHRDSDHHQIPVALYHSQQRDAFTLGEPAAYQNCCQCLSVNQQFAGVGHYVYINQAPKILQKISPLACSDYGGLRPLVQQQVVNSVQTFLAAQLNQAVQPLATLRGVA